MRVRTNTGEPVEITTVAERPHLLGSQFDAGEWPEFMRYNRIAEAYFARASKVFPEVCLIATTDDGTVVADGQAVRLAANRLSTWPSGGWEHAVVQAFLDVDRTVDIDIACALNISVANPLRGNGLSRLMLEALRTAAADAGASALLAPVRPTWKAREPRTPMPEYAERVRDDGLPYDPWLRTHVRVGGQIAGIASTSWVIADSLPRWRTWTGLPFDTDGPTEVRGALVPVHCDIQNDHAVYIEPNIWVEHDLRTREPPTR